MDYNKQYFINLLNKIILPVKDCYSDGCAGLNIGHTGAVYGNAVIPMEGFSRILWGLVPYWYGGGTDNGFEEIYIKGLTNGPDSGSGEYWGNTGDYDQKYVEMAAIAYGLILTPEKLWEPLTNTAKKRLADYLRNINYHKVPDNNWLFFPLLVNLALKRLGQPYNNEKIEYALTRIEEFYLGNGWYFDGNSKQRDYYIPFAIHFYSLIYSKVCCEEDKERCKLFRDRAAKFAGQFIYWFDEKGRALVYGRSLTYRFAQAAFWSACLFADVPVFDYSIIKGILIRHFEEWLSNPIFDKAGLLTIGYRYPNLNMSECYNAPGSPYWSLKTFILLALPDEHPFWSAEPAPLPALDKTKFLKEAQMIIQHSGSSVTALVTGRIQYTVHTHISEKYCKFAYSSEFGFSVPRSNKALNQAAPDSTLAFEIDGYIFTRRLCSEISISDHEIKSIWSPFSGIEVETTLIPIENGHIRRHKITSNIKCTARDCGFAVSAESECRTSAENGIAVAENSFSCCTVKTNTGKAETATMQPNTSLVYRNTVIPMAVYEIGIGTTEIETVVMYKA